MSHTPVTAVSLSAIRAAQARLAAIAVRTPLVRCDGGASDSEVFLKLDNLQPSGSFKIRPVGNAVLARPAASLASGL